MDDVVKMIGYFVLGVLVLIAGLVVLQCAASILTVILATPIGILALFIMAIAILKKCSRK